MARVDSRPSVNRPAAGRPKSSGNDSESMWSSMLDSVSSGTRLSSKTLLILGGTVESQKNFLDALSNEPTHRRRNIDKSITKKPPVANRFALGYTYQDVLDADQEDILARVSEYLISDPSLALPSLLQPLFTSSSIPDLAVAILLDWAEPWNWLRQLRDWIRILRRVTKAAHDDAKEAMDENMKSWSQRHKSPGVENQSSGAEKQQDTLPLTLGPGEWDEPLGVPLCVVCQNAEKIEILEREYNWKDREFDTVLMYLRTILLKHGASLIYTASSAPGSLQILVKSSLAIYSLLQRDPLKHNVHDRDKVLVPPNWDSWGKIRLLQDSCPGFDFEAISTGWSIDMQDPQNENTAPTSATESPVGAGETSHQPDASDGGAVSSYEELIRNPEQTYNGHVDSSTKDSNEVEVHCPSNQEFFAEQLERLEQFRREDEQAQKTKDARKATASPIPGMRDSTSDANSKISEHIGPVQFNMGGIQVDADEMLQTLREREAGRADAEDDSLVSSPDSKSENDNLRSFFASLASRGGSSAANSPR